MLLGGKQSPGGTVETNIDHKAAGCYVKGYFGGGKGAVLEIQQAW